MQKLRQHPILILLIVNVVVGLFTLRSYGFSWDEPLFYDYADALRYAYSPKEWFSGDFDLYKAFGSSGTDHANRGPAYVVIARPFVSLVELSGLDIASAWHLINFLTFQLGVYLFYRFTKRYVSKSAALAATALFAWQPLLWGHAFINPKDMPFMVFFLGAVCFGFELVDHFQKDLKISDATARDFKSGILPVLLASFFLGIATSIRVLGPLAGIFAGLYALSGIRKTSILVLIKYFSVYAFFTMFFSLATWPYLWLNPIQKFIEVFGFMSGNPTHLPVLFGGNVYTAGELPRRYLPVLLTITLTEPVLPLFAVGLLFAFFRKPRPDLWSLVAIALWFFIPFSYVLLRKPTMYDGYRHFLFMLPPIFIFAGFAFEKIFEYIAPRGSEEPLPPRRKFFAALRMISLTLLVLAPSIYGSIQLHPYEYAYYNSFIGGTSGAFRTYETEYWLTCYKEAVENFDQKNVNLFVRREHYIAAYYAEGINVRSYRYEFGQIQTGDYVLVNTRTNEDKKTFRDAPVVLEIRRGNAIFCEVKRIP